ncbi:MAG: hypothetical protein RL425_842 [Pseudomonadota bacterium]|jgi:PAS domain S-box-containing protein
MVFSANGTKRVHDATSFLAFTVVYAVFAYFGLTWAMVDGAGSPIWPAAGIGFAGLLLCGTRFWPAIVIGRTIAALISGSQQPFLADIFLGFANAIATLAAYLLIRASGGLKIGLPSFGDVLRYVLAGALPYAVLVAVIGLFTLRISSGISLHRIWLMFVPCVIGHFVGAATIGTLILSWWRPTRPLSSRDLTHFLTIFAATAIATTFIFGETDHGNWPTWQLFPFLVWTAIAFGVRGTSVMLVGISFIALYKTGIIWMTGALPPPHMPSQIWKLQQFLATQALTMVLLAAAVDELRAQADLKRRDLMLRQAMTAGATGIFRWNFEANQVECDDTLLRLLDMPPEQTPKRLQDLIAVLHPDDQLRILTSYEDCARHGTEISTTARVMSRDGQSRSLNVRGRCVESQAGASAFVTGAVVDITERTQLERRLIEAEQIYRAVFEQAGVGVARLSLTGAFLEVNERFCDITGRPSDQLVGYNWLAISNDPTWQIASVEFGALLAVGDGRFRVEKNYQDPKRGTVWVDMSITLVRDAQHAPLFYLAIVQDVTEAKTAEERAEFRASELETVLDAVPSAIWLAQDPDCSQIIGNRFSSKILREATSEDEKRTAANPPPESYKVFDAEGRELDDADLPVQRAARGETVRNFEERILFNDGQTIHLFGNATPLLDTDGRVRGAVAAFIDITERKRAEARERLLSREVDHRSKNVLAIVQAIIQLTQAPNMAAYRARITGRIQSLSRTHNLLAETKWDGVMLARLIHDELSPFETDEEAAPNQQRFTVNGPDIILNPSAAQAFALILHEMLTNAVKYGALTAPNGRVQISWSCLNTPADKLCFTWQESDGPPTQEPERAGFGWTVIRSSVEEQMRGTLHTEWTETGLRMTIEIPMNEVSEPSRPSPMLSAA